MQFTNFAALLTLLPLAVLAAPAPLEVSPSCTGGSYATCVADTMCIQSWPESCECANAAKARCAVDCGGGRPALQDCTAGTSTTKKRADCYTTCFEDKVCIQSWPAGCTCANANRVSCANSCGVVVPTLQNCS
ncbi:hypothetical protein EDC01DRAFT_360828 [Geopyxis carbonaria]|nr:hypothetical protein EDC01DRAFT_360828 [Geopyxis carbonaria]